MTGPQTFRTLVSALLQDGDTHNVGPGGSVHAPGPFPAPVLLVKTWRSEQSIPFHLHRGL